MLSPSTWLGGALALLASSAMAQTFTNCDPTKKTCPNDPALGMHHDFVFNASSVVTDAFNVTAGSLDYGADGAEFTIHKKGESPTIISKFYIFFGSVSVIMKTAKGTGIISSIVLESDDLDEVDWEFMGGNGTHAESNYFGKGNTTSFDRAIYYPMSSDPREDFHNYTIDWNSERLIWLIDSIPVRTLAFADANGGKNYPQTPCTIRLGIWAGGDDSMPQGTREWAGGETTYTDVPYTMYVKSAAVTDYSSGREYEYTDQSGSWQSIKAIQGNSTVTEQIVKGANRQPSKSLSQKFAALPQSTKTAIFASIGAAGAILLGAFLFICCRMRRAGRRERDQYNALAEQQREENAREQMELREKGMGKSGFQSPSVVSVASIPPVPSLPSLPPMPSPALLNNEKASYFDAVNGSGNRSASAGYYASAGPSPYNTANRSASAGYNYNGNAAAIPLRKPSPASGGFGSGPVYAPNRAMTASPLDMDMGRSMSPPVLVPIPGQAQAYGQAQGYTQRNASPSVGMQSPRGYHPF